MKAFAAACQLGLTLSLFSLSVFGQLPLPREDTRNKVYDPWGDELKNPYLTRLRPEARVIRNGPFAPSEQDRQDYAVFLKQRNTGLIRLLPYQRDNEKITRGGGSYYSFHYLSHEYGSGSDLQLVRPRVLMLGQIPKKDLGSSLDMLSVGFAGADYGMLTNLGDVPLDEITVKDSRVRYLKEYEPPDSDPEARCEKRRFGNGETIDGRWYRRSLPVQVGATYLLRSIVYHESDVLVVFRVTRQDAEGSVIIAWKLLKDIHPRQLRNINSAGKCN